MNRYRYEDLYVGMKETFSVTMRKDMLDAFRRLTGDPNPLHTDMLFAQAYGFNERVVYGMLTAAFLSTLGGGYIPGERCLIQSVEVKFLRPVFVGDTLEVCGIVEELHDSVRQVILRVEIHNQHGERVLRGRMKTGVLDERA